MYPRELGKYRILKLLPLGGMGRVYLATDTLSNAEVALKLIDLEGGPEQVEIVDAERRGAILQARLCGLDSRIVQVNAYGELNEYYFIEMEYIHGQDLSEVLAKGPLGVPFAARIGADICGVLDVTHTFRGEIDDHSYHGVVHGDIKPRNIRITDAGQVKVLDFGIAKALSLTRRFTRNSFASSQYSSPERLNTGEVDVASDLWSVGVVLFEVVTGQPYFSNDSGEKLDNIIRNYREVRPLPSTIAAPFRAILRKALSPNPERRYTTAAAFASDLHAFLNGKPTVAETETEPVFNDESTRRTAAPIAPLDDSAPTRRTAAPSPQQPPAQAGRAVPVQHRPARQMGRRERQFRFFGSLALLLFTILMFYREYHVWAQAHDLQRDLATEKLTDLNEAWSRYDVLAKSSHIPLVLTGTRNAIEERLTSAADRVIEEYRNSDIPSVNEADWSRADASLAKALQLDPGDKEIRGKMLLCEGHVSRIRAEARHNLKLASEARGRFEQAHELIGNSPDPYLGLARIYAYSLRDADRAEEALKQASKKGHKMGRREKAQLGDVYRDRAEKLMAEADRSQGLPEEKDFLKRSQKDFQRAEELFRDIVPFGGSANSLRRVLDYLAAIDTRLQNTKDGI